MEEKFNKYDNFVSDDLVNIKYFCHDSDKLILEDININDENDLFFLEMAKIVSQMYDKKIYLKVSLKDLFKIRTKLFKPKKKFFDKKKYEDGDGHFPTKKIKEFMAMKYNTSVDICGDIYREYYKKGK